MQTLIILASKYMFAVLYQTIFRVLKWFFINFRQHFQSEKILTFERLLKLLETNELTVFLLASHTNAKLIELVREAIGNNSLLTKRIVFCCSSPIAIYQVGWLIMSLELPSQQNTPLGGNSFGKERTYHEISAWWSIGNECANGSQLG